LEEKERLNRKIDVFFIYKLLIVCGAYNLLLMKLSNGSLVVVAIIFPLRRPPPPLSLPPTATMRDVIKLRMNHKAFNTLVVGLTKKAIIINLYCQTI